MNKNHFSDHIKLENVTLDDPFWNEIIKRVRDEVIPYQYNALWDRVEGAEKSYSIENFIKAGEIVSGKRERKIYPCDKWCYDEKNAEKDAFHGWVFQDTDVYKWLEAAAYSLTCYPDSELEAKADAVIDIVCAAQLENGYLDTLYIINNPDEAFSNLRDFHELYCFGHLCEAAIAYYNATKKDKLLCAATRFADLICSVFGEGGGKIKGYPGHEIAEEALLKLYELTGCKKYLDIALFFINERGKRPYYFDTERGESSKNENYHYNQAHRPVREQREAVGHAVRGVYLYTALANAAKKTGDETLLSACEDIWNNIENKKLYITGGIGATVHGEAFSFDYDLPNDLAYSETCASIGLIFFARRMAEINPNSRFGDVAERALYNTVLASMSQDGKSFFYVNPLEVLPTASRVDERKRHIKPVRQKWFSCACCPPNLARLLSSLGEYAFAENESTFFVHQHIGAEVKTGFGNIKIVSKYAESGRETISIKPEKPFTLAVRIPSWSSDYTISEKYKLKDGYAYIAIKGECEIEFDFSMSAKLVKCSNKVRANVGKVALQKGMFVYCLEEKDNGSDLQMLKINGNTTFEERGDFIIADGLRELPDKELYCDVDTTATEDVKIKFLPYYLWGNRGENEMSVYIRLSE